VTHWHKIFTGEVPFHNLRPTTVAVEILSGNRPERPAHPSFTDDLWGLTNRCWNHDPQQRPDISQVILSLRTWFPSRYSDDEIPDGTTLGSVQQCEPVMLEASRCQASQRSPAFCGLDRLWKSGRSCSVSRPAPGQDTAYELGSERREKSVDTGWGSCKSGPARRKSRQFPRDEAHPTRSRDNRRNSSLEKRGTNTRHSVSGSNCCCRRVTAHARLNVTPCPPNFFPCNVRVYRFGMGSFNPLKHFLSVIFSHPRQRSVWVIVECMLYPPCRGGTRYNDN